MAVNQFEVFGVDVRDYGQLWVAAWRDFLFGDDSPVRDALDSQVNLRFSDGAIATYQAGREVAGDHVETEVLAVPDELVLSRVLTLPSIAEADLEAALHLEIAACSPFSSDDTAAGWRVTREGEESNLRVDLVIASRSAVVGFLIEHFNAVDAHAFEVWANTGAHWVCLRGFGERKRETIYRRRLVRTCGLIASSLVLLLILAGVSVALTGRELANLELQRDVALQEARAAIALRDELAATNLTIAELNELSFRLPNPQPELLRLTQLLPDSAYITQYTQEGRSIKLRGRGTAAASLQQAMTQEPAFEQVTAPQAISRVGNTGLEQFFLDIQLKASP
ncbi:MAG: PilN domain-containing protein [Luminiphilus sp.]|nr:PilN domain-containing protein [Luminiphilus sp.]